MYIFSSKGVTTCELVKTTCRYCDLMNPNCVGDIFNGYNQNQCYNAVDGITNVMGEYQLETSECHMMTCRFTTWRYMETRVIIMTACLSGIYILSIYTV